MKQYIINVILRPIYRLLTRKMAVGKNVRYHSDLHVGRRSCIMAPTSLDIGRRVRIGMHTWIAVNGTIEDGVQISSYVGVVGKNDHGIAVVGQRPFDAPWVWDGTLPVNEQHSIVLERDAWVGYGATLLSGIRVGRGSVIAAGAVVTKDVPPYAIMAGNPARQIGSLFSPDDILRHEAILAEREELITTHS
ncbi:MAG: acyltransferase [Pseudomonadota bacterium]